LDFVASAFRRKELSRETEETFPGFCGLNRWDRVRRMLLAAIDVVAAPELRGACATEPRKARS
jgi:hypothetical protein